MTFSLAGLSLVVALVAPNLVMIALPPRNAVAPPPENRVLTALERAGQAGCIGLTVMAGERLGIAMGGPWAHPAGAAPCADVPAHRLRDRTRSAPPIDC